MPRSRSARRGGDARSAASADLCVWSFHPNKNVTSIEGGALVVERRARGAAGGDAALPRHRAPARRHARRGRGGRQVQPARRQRGRGAAPDRAARGIQRAAPRARARRYLDTLRTDPPLELPPPGYPGDADGHSFNLFAPLLPLPRSSLTSRARSSRAALEATRHRHSACRTRRRTSPRHSPARGYHRGDLPHTERIADSTVTLPLFPTMTGADVDRVCAACAEVIAASRAVPGR